MEVIKLLTDAELQDYSHLERYSHSKLNTFHQCPYSWKLNYVYGVDGVQNGFAEFGIIVHGLLEDYLNKKVKYSSMPSELKQRIKQGLSNGVVLKPSDTHSIDLTKKYLDETIRFCEDFTHFEDVEVIEVERKFNLLVEMNGKMFILTGVIDVVGYDGKNYYVIDWKSKAKFKNKKEVDTYARQLYMYSLYIKAKYGVYPLELWFVQFRINHYEKIKFDTDRYAEVLQWIEDTEVQISQADSFEKNQDDFFCRNLCNFGQESGICDWKGSK